MIQQMTCSRGHQWTYEGDRGDGDATVNSSCPRCGSRSSVSLAQNCTLDGSSLPAANSVAVPDTINQSGSVANGSVMSDTLVPPERPTKPMAAVVDQTLMPSSELSASAGNMHDTLMPSGDLASAEAATVPSWKEPVQRPPSHNEVPGYEIIKELGRGGMGVVYKARHVRSNRLVALKMILSGGHASRGQLERFRIEGQAVARLQHPNIVQVFDLGEHDGRPYFSLEFLDGGSLDDQLDGTPWPARATAQVVEVLARAMQHAHEKNIVHRDLKPANVLLGKKITATRAGATPGEDATELAQSAKITDFGLAKQMEVNHGQTQSGDVLGTPSYMAPEQAEGNIAAIGPCTDVYALGAILYELLTGKPPFKGTTLIETLEFVRVQEPVPPRQIHLHAPRDLETICLKCLAKEPAKRYASAAELADDLKRFLDGEPIKARPVGTTERVYRWCKRNPKVAGLLTALVVVTLVGLISVTGLWMHAEKQRDRAEGNLRKALGAVDTYMTEVSESRLKDEPGAGELRRELLKKAADYYTQFVKENEDVAQVRAELGKSLFRLGQIFGEINSSEEGIEYHKKALAVFEELRKAQPKDAQQRFNIAATHHNLGRLSRLNSDTEAAERHYREALAIWENLVREQPDSRSFQAELARTLRGLGNLATVRGLYPDAEKHYRMALETSAKLAGAEPDNETYQRELATDHDNLASLYESTAQLTKAEKESQAAGKILEALVKKQPKITLYRNDLARNAYNSAARAARMGDSVKAQAAYQKAIDLWARLGHDHPLVSPFQLSLARSYAGQGDVLRGTKKSDEADKLYGQSLKILEDVNASDPGNADFQYNLAKAYRRAADVQREQNQPDKARDGYLQALQVLERLVKDHAEVAEYPIELMSVHNQLGLVLRQKDETAGEKHFRAGLKIAQDQVKAGKKSPALQLEAAICRRSLANFQRLTKRHDEALKELALVVADLEPLYRDRYSLGRVVPELAKAWWNQAQSLEEQGDPDRADAAWKKALELADKEAKDIVFNRSFYRTRRAYALTQQGKYAEAVGLWETVLRDEKANEKLFTPELMQPRVRDGQLGRLTALVLSGAHVRATTEAEALLPILGPGKGQAGAAEVFALAAGLARGDEKLDAAERMKLAEQYGSRAVVLLGDAAKANWFANADNLKQLKESRNLNALRERADFKALLKRFGG